jgi:hypothetical protein
MNSLSLGLGLEYGGALTLAQRAISTLRRLGATVIGLPDNVLGDGAPNLLSAPEFAGGLADATTRGGLLTLASMTGYDNAIAFGHDGVTGSYAYKNFTHTNGLTYTLSVIVRMDDGAAPTFAVVNDGSTSANTFALVFGGSVINPTLLTVQLQPDGNYRVSGTWVSSGAISNFGIVKYASNNNSTFKVTGYKLELGSVATAYTTQSVLVTRGTFIDSTGTTPVTAVGDVIGRVNDRIGSNHATQATTASKPMVVINAQGKKVISFDGSNDFLQLSQPVFTAANDDGFVCAGVVPTTITGVQAVVASRGPSGTPTSCANGLFMSSGTPLAYWEGGVSTTLTGSAVTAGTPLVISARKAGTSVSLRVNGAVAQSGATSVTNTTIASTSIGISLSGTANDPLLPGNEKITVAVICKGVVSDADALLIEKWIGSLQGQTL